MRRMLSIYYKTKPGLPRILGNPAPPRMTERPGQASKQAPVHSHALRSLSLRPFPQSRPFIS